MAKIHTHNREIDFIEHYKGRNIVNDDGTIMVHDPQWDTLFIVCMDDSKSCGRRTCIHAFNYIPTCTCSETTDDIQAISES